jgi:hypothetical protein
MNLVKPKAQLSTSFCSTNQPPRPVCLTSKSDPSSTKNLKKIITANVEMWPYFIVLLKSDFNVKQTCLYLPFASLVTPKVGANLELLFNELPSGL